MIKMIMVFSLSIGSMWDGFTTLIGTNDILNGIIPSITFTILIFGFMVATSFIFRSSGLLGFFLKIFWITALMYDLYTSYLGNIKYIIANSTMNDEQLLLIIVFTLLATASPMLIGLVYNSDNDQFN